MNYLLQNKKNKKRFTPLVVVIIAICIVLLVTFFSPFFFASMSNGVGRPIWIAGNFIFGKTGDNFRAFVFSRQEILEKNKNIANELAEAKIKLLTLPVLQRENEELKQTRGREVTEERILAVVLVKPPQSLYDTFVLDVGENKNIKQGNDVVVGDSIILGKIDEVFGKTSRAKLFSSVDLETLAIVDRNNIGVTLVGKGSGNFEIKLPQEVDIVQGDTIILPSIKPSIVATVLEIESNPTNSFKRVFCKTPVNIAQLRFVSIVKEQI